MIARLGIVVLAFGLGACGAASTGAWDDGGSEYPCDSGGTERFAATPMSLVRGAAEEITVTWRTVYEVRNPRVTLGLGQDPRIELDLPLEYDANQPEVTYFGTVLNPYGVGAPAGTIEVLGTGDPLSGCDYALTATTTFRLE